MNSKAAVLSPERSSKLEKPSVIVVEDDSATRRLISSYLSANGFSVMEASSVESASRLLSILTFKAMILDIELEDGEGLDLLTSGARAPRATIIVSARDKPRDRITGLEQGADDYLVKPIDLRELLLRVNRSIERTSGGEGSAEMEILLDEAEHVRLDLVERAIMKGEKVVANLPNREYRVLRLLIENTDNVISREFISREIMGRRVVGESRAVDMLVSSVRRKLMSNKIRLYIRSVRGEGYVLTRKGSFFLANKLESTTEGGS